ncbi:MAG: peptidoglycan editing factor PgeF [Ignavibacteria bacterium]|nr:peptidoglycan editing factor PgeF [Ignavibacteria bacterium]
MFVRRHSSLRFGLSTREGEFSSEPYGMNVSFRVGDDPEHVRRNREAFFKLVGCAEDQIAIPVQCHSSHVMFADGAGSYIDVDGLVTDRRDLFLAVTVADCVPIFLFDPSKRAIGVIHAGWKGSAAGIITCAVAKMREHFHSRPEDLFAHLGASARRCCYAVGEDVAGQFRSEVIHRREGAMYLDLVAENIRQLVESGCRSENIETSEWCTICAPHVFHSYRRDGHRSGRMMGILGIISEKGD